MNEQGCTVCKNEEKLLEKFNGMLSIEVKGDKLCIWDEDFINRKYTVKINYCPNCGRKLLLDGTKNGQKDYFYYDISYMF